MPRSLYLWWILTTLLAGGCASVTNPVANGVPARLLPEDLLGESKEELVPIPLAWLRVKPPEEYRLDKGDIIGVYIEGALGDRDQVPPIHFPQVAGVPPSIGFPIPVGERGFVPLPLVKKVKVAGMTIEEAQAAIENAYTSGDKKYLDPEQARILVTLVRPRQARILVIREDTQTRRTSLNDPTFRLFGSAPTLGPQGQGSGNVLELPETEADVLSALARTGGLPGPTAANEVIVYRGFSHLAGHQVPSDWQADPPSNSETPRAIRIPMRIKPGTPPSFTVEDIKLRSGDILYIPSRETDVYYTGGLMPAREVPLPRDYDLRTVEAVLRVGGPIVNGGRFIATFSGTGSFASGLGNPNPSLLTILRRTPGGRQVAIRVDLNKALRDPRENLLVQPGDVLLLQETPSEAVARYFSQAFNFGALSDVFVRGSARGQATVNFP